MTYTAHPHPHVVCRPSVSFARTLCLAHTFTLFIKIIINARVFVFTATAVADVKDGGFRLGAPPLALAALSNKPECVAVLIEHKADVEEKDKTGSTALMWAAKSGRLACATLLLEHGANANARNNVGSTPLIWAATYGRMDCVRLLLENGANKAATTSLGISARDAANKGGHTEVAALIEAHM